MPHTGHIAHNNTTIISLSLPLSPPSLPPQPPTGCSSPLPGACTRSVQTPTPAPLLGVSSDPATPRRLRLSHLATLPGVQAAAAVAVHRTGGGVHKDGRAEQTAALRVQLADYGDHHHQQHHCRHLVVTPQHQSDAQLSSRPSETQMVRRRQARHDGHTVEGQPARCKITLLIRFVQ